MSLQKGFSGTIGVLLALAFVFIGLPSLCCIGFIVLGTVRDASQTASQSQSLNDFPKSKSENGKSEVDSDSGNEKLDSSEAIVDEDSTKPVFDEGQNARSPAIHEQSKTESASDEKEKGDGEIRLLSQLSGSELAYAKYRIANDYKRPKLESALPERLDTGDVGELVRNSDEYTFAVSQIIDDENMLIFGNRFWVEGISTRSLTEYSTVSTRGIVFEVKGTKRYTTVLGASRTVKHIAFIDASKADAVVAKIRELRNAKAAERELAEAIRERERQAAKAKAEAEKRNAEFRTWKTVDGKFTVEARMDAYRSGVVSLEKRDGTIAKVPMDKLSDEDKTYIEQVKKTGKR